MGTASVPGSRGDTAEVWEQGTTPGLRNQGEFPAPSKTAQGPYMGKLEVEEAIEHWERESVARGHWGLPEQLTPSPSSGTNGSAVLAQSLPWLCPLPQGWGIRPEGTTEGPSASPHHSSPAEPLPRAGVSMKSSLSWRLLLIPKGPLGSAWLPECSWAGLVGAAARHWHINAPS